MTVRKIKVFLFKIVLTKFCENSTCSFLPRNKEMWWLGWGRVRDRNSDYFCYRLFWFSLKQCFGEVFLLLCQIVAHFDYMPLEFSTLFKSEKKQKMDLWGFSLTRCSVFFDDIVPAPTQKH